MTQVPSNPFKAWEEYLRPFITNGAGLSKLDESTTSSIPPQLPPQILQRLEKLVTDMRKKAKAKKDVKIGIFTGGSSNERTRLLSELPALLSDKFGFKAVYSVTFRGASRLCGYDIRQGNMSSGKSVAMRLIYQAVHFHTVHMGRVVAHPTFEAWIDHVHNALKLEDIDNIKTAIRLLGGSSQQKCAVVIDQVDVLVEDIANLRDVPAEASRLFVMEKLIAVLRRIMTDTQISGFIAGTPPESFFNGDTPGSNGYKTGINAMNDFRLDIPLVDLRVIGNDL